MGRGKPRVSRTHQQLERRGRALPYSLQRQQALNTPGCDLWPPALREDTRVLL